MPWVILLTEYFLGCEFRKRTRKYKLGKPLQCWAVTDGKKPVVGLHLQMTKPCRVELWSEDWPPGGQMHAIAHPSGHFVRCFGFNLWVSFPFPKAEFRTQKKFKALGCTAELWPPLGPVSHL